MKQGYLLDTNTALIALTEPSKLPVEILAAVLAGPNVLSVVSYWEVTIKSMKGTLKVSNPGNWWQDALDQLAATALALHSYHVKELYNLRPLHKDPFDRILIAQATVEELRLVTMDGEIPLYASARFSVLAR